MMRYVGIFLILIGIMAISVIAQTNEDVTSPQRDDTISVQPTATPESTPIIERQYPIAAGVWYPGDPVPTVPSRYYRIRCWPGCHSYGEYADPENIKKASEKKAATSN